METIKKDRNQNQHNLHLTEEELLHAINYENIEKLKDLGVAEQMNLNFKL